MKGKRNKQYRKLMQQYALSFGFREPYQVIVDAQMIQDTQRFTMDLVAGLERTLSGKVKPLITQCSIRHLYELSGIPSPLKDSMILVAKSMERRRCNHHTLEKPLSTFECLSSVVDSKNSLTNRHRYIVASQDEDVRRHCRRIKGVPLVYVKRSVMVMEPMAQGSIGAREGMEREKLKSGIRGNNAALGKRKREGEEDRGEKALGSEDKRLENSMLPAEGQSKSKRVRGPKGPNPLSMKKPSKLREAKTDAQDRQLNRTQDDSKGDITSSPEHPKGKRRKKRRKAGQPPVESSNMTDQPEQHAT